MKHKLHDLLIAAANDSEARFTSTQSHNSCTIKCVLDYPDNDWVLVDKPKQPKYLYVFRSPIDWTYYIAPNKDTDNEYAGKIEVLNDD